MHKTASFRFRISLNKNTLWPFTFLLKSYSTTQKECSSSETTPASSQSKRHHFHLSKASITILPALRSIPVLVIGMPVARDSFCFASVMPSARFNENVKPGMSLPMLDEPFFSVFLSPNMSFCHNNS